MESQTFKLILVGESGVGKTVFVKKLRTSSFEEKHVKTLGVEVHPLRFETSHGQICFNVWDTAGDYRLAGLDVGYYLQSQCALYMFDCTQMDTTIARCKYFADRINQTCGELPCVVVGNKYENLEMDNFDDSIFHISTKEDEMNILKAPFLKLARLLTQQPDLVFL